MIRPAAHPFPRPATIGALALALLLAACGLKGQLDPPPSSTEAPPPAQMSGQPQSTIETDAPPPPPAKRRFFLNWLLE